jgi:thiaminase (transcriptional activator TenA)
VPVSGAADDLWRVMSPIHSAIMRHPFVTGLTDGTLPADAFARYVVQDALYLREYARALALCGARAGEVETLRMFCLHAAEAVEAERDLHSRLMGELGIDASTVAGTEPSPTCRGYTGFLLSACALGDRHEAFAAVLPCYWIYWEVGRSLAERGSPDPRYAAWIDVYGGDDFAEAARAAIAACDAALAGLPARAMDSARAHALTAARYEWLFWDAAWADERWPDGSESLPSPRGD